MYKEILTLALPLIASSFAFSCMMFLDRIFLGKYAMDHLAASGSAGWVSFSIGSLAFGIIGYTTSIASHYVGAHKDSKLTSPMWQALYLALFMSLIILLCVFPFARHIFVYFKHEPQLIPLETGYLRLLLITTCLNLFSSAMSSFLLSQKKTMLVMFSNTSAIIVNIILDYWFIFGGWGLPAMGIWGAGLATIGGALTSTILSSLFSMDLAKKIKTPFFHPYDKSEMRQLLRYGLPAALQLTLSSVGPTWMALNIGKMGTLFMLAYTIVGSIQAMFYMPTYGVISAMNTLVGQSAGAHEFKRVCCVLKKTILICLAYALFLAPIFIFAHSALLRLFMNKEQWQQFPEIVLLTQGIFVILALSMFVQACQGILIQLLKTLGDTRYSMCAYALGLLLIWVAPTVLLLKTTPSLLAVMMPMIAFNVIMSLVWHTRYQSEKWKKHLLIR